MLSQALPFFYNCLILNLMNIVLVVLLVVAGVVLLLLEIFLLPGFGIAGIAGFLSLVGAVVAAYLRIGATAGHITLAGVLVAVALSVYAFIRGRALQRMSLDTAIDSKVDLASPGKKIENLEREATAMGKKEEKRIEKATQDTEEETRAEE